MNSLKRHRIDAGLTIKELADATGVGVGTISSIENGSGAHVKTLVTLSKFLSKELSRTITPSELLTVPERNGSAA